ncbi:hypothetical protein D3C74_466350 [compost metagenome]
MSNLGEIRKNNFIAVVLGHIFLDKVDIIIMPGDAVQHFDHKIVLIQLAQTLKIAGNCRN